MRILDRGGYTDVYRFLKPLCPPGQLAPVASGAAGWLSQTGRCGHRAWDAFSGP